MLHPAQTRWLSLIAAVDRVVEQWGALKLYFTDARYNEKSTLSEQIYIWLNDPYVKLYLLFLKYVLPKFTKLNEYFRSTKVVLTSLDSKFKETYRDLIIFKDNIYINQNIHKADRIDPNNLEN